MTRILTLTALLMTLVTLTACETAEGFGQDVQSAGAAITDEARDAQ
jgi:predicted small secreted protein